MSDVKEASGRTGRKEPRTWEPEMQEPHSAEDCLQNEIPHSHPDAACDHFVPTGPATGMQDPDGDGVLEKAPSYQDGPGTR